MTIKLTLLKSGEDIIADVTEMCIGEEENRRVVGYYLDKPCVVKMRNPNLLTENETQGMQKSGFEVSLLLISQIEEIGEENVRLYDKFNI